MGVLDILAAVVKDNEAKKAYGTPFYQQKLAELDAEQQARSIGNQQSQLNLAQDTEMGPVQLEAAKSLIPERTARTEAIQAGTEAVQAKNSPERLALQDDLRRAEMEYKAQTNTNKQLESAARIAQINARIKKMDQPSAPKRDRLQLKQNDDGSYDVINLDAAYNAAQGGGQPGGMPTGPSAPIVAPTGMQGKPSAELQGRRDQAGLILQEAAPLLEEIDKMKGQLGPGIGSFNKIRDLAGVAPEGVRALRTKLGIVADLLPKLHGFRGGTAMTSEFKRLVGDINQTPENLQASVEAILGVAKLVQGGASRQQIESATDAAIAKMHGGAAPAAPAGTRPQQKIGRFTVQVE